MGRGHLVAILPLMLAACGTALPDLGAPGGGPVARARVDDALAPPGRAGGAGVDPVIVGDRLLAAGEAELALDSYLQAAADRGLTPDLLRSMAGANLALGRLGQAETLARQAVEAAPEDGLAWNDLGAVLMERGETGEAHQAFRRAFALNPHKPEILANLRLSLEKLEALRYAEAQDEAFTLTRRRDGVYELSAAQ